MPMRRIRNEHMFQSLEATKIHSEIGISRDYDEDASPPNNNREASIGLMSTCPQDQISSGNFVLSFGKD